MKSAQQWLDERMVASDLCASAMVKWINEIQEDALVEALKNNTNLPPMKASHTKHAHSMKSADQWLEQEGFKRGEYTREHLHPIILEIQKDAFSAGVESVPHPSSYTYCSTQITECAVCHKHKHTPLRNDEMGGYVCLTCIDHELERLQKGVK